MHLQANAPNQGNPGTKRSPDVWETKKEVGQSGMTKRGDETRENSKEGEDASARGLLYLSVAIDQGGLQKSEAIRTFTEWLTDKSVPLPNILARRTKLSPLAQKLIEEEMQKLGAQNSQNPAGIPISSASTFRALVHLTENLAHLNDPGVKKLSGQMHRIPPPTGNPGENPNYPENLTTPVDSQNEGDHPRFQRLSFYDSGNLGELFLTHDRELHRTVVSKFIRVDQSHDPFARSLFHLEAEVTGSLEHPGIVPVYGLGHDSKGRIFYAMRLIQGQKLTKKIEECFSRKTSQGLLGEDLYSLLDTFSSACLALEYAHSKGVIHCDIKPDNIMVGDFGENFVVDWGLVVVEGVNHSGTSGHGQTNENYNPSTEAAGGLHFLQGGKRKGVGGTPAYMAPEQMRATMEDNISLVGKASDIFGLGATLYHILTGVPPLLPNKKTKENHNAFYQRILRAEFPKPSRIEPTCPPPLESIVLKAMARDPEKRYSSARELDLEIRRFLADEVVHSHKERFRERLRRWRRKNPGKAVLIFCLLFFSLIGSMGFSIERTVENKRLLDSEGKAQQSAQLASRLAAEETEAKLEALKEKARAEDLLSDLKSSLYGNLVQSSATAWSNGRADQAWYRLLATDPSQRGVEFHYLARKYLSGYSELPGHHQRVVGLAFIKGGRIISASLDGTLAISGIHVRKVLKVVSPSGGSIHSMALARNEKWAITAGADTSANIIETENLKTVGKYTGHKKPVQAVAISPDSRWAATGDTLGEIHIWDHQTSQLKSKITDSPGRVGALAFSPDGKYIAGASDNGDVVVWETDKTHRRQVFKGHQGRVTSLSFNSAGTLLASAAEDDTIRVWDTNTAVAKTIIAPRTGVIHTVAFLPWENEKNEIVASGGSDMVLRIWDPLTGRSLGFLSGSTAPIYCVARSTESFQISTGMGNGTIKLWDPTVPPEPRILAGHAGPVRAVAFSPSGDRVASGSKNGVVKLWNSKDGVSLWINPAMETPVQSIRFSRNGEQVFTNGPNNTIQILAASSGKPLGALSGHTGPVTGMAALPEENRLLSVSEDGTLRLWDTNTKTNLQTISAHGGKIREVAYSPKSRLVATVSQDKIVRIWGLPDLRLIHTFNRSTTALTSVDFTPDGERIIASNDKGEFFFWNAIAGQMAKTIQPDTQPIHSVRLVPAHDKPTPEAPENWHIVATQGDSGLVVLSLKTGRRILGIDVGRRTVLALDMHPTTSRIVGGDEDGGVRIFDYSPVEHVDELHRASARPNMDLKATLP